MRCPKCSFISYDQVDTCAKCGKNISTAAGQLHGTTVNVPAPEFLQFTAEEPGPQYDAETEAVGEESAGLEAGDEEFVDFSIEEDDSPEIEIAADEVEMEISEDEPDIELDDEPEVAEAEESIDISDLAPSDDVEPEIEEVVDEVTEEVAEEEYVEELVAEGAGHEGQGLKDLKVDIDLEASEAPKGKVMPSVKTGTALDDFDIDLGDLLTSKKE